MINSISFSNSVKGSIAVAIIAILGFSSIASASSATLVPSCEINITPSTITSAQSATLKWDSTAGAIFANLDNGVGAIAPDGEMIVSPSKSTVYTMRSWNSQGEGGYCSVAVTVDGIGLMGSVQPTITLQTIAIHPALRSVTLGNVPHTGTTENIVYILFLFSLLLTAGYVFTTQRKTVFV